MPLAKKSYSSQHQLASLPGEDINTKCAKADDDLGLGNIDQFGLEDDEQPKRRHNSQGDEIGAKLKHELSKYKQELEEYNETTRDLEKKYMKINDELSEMQQKHDQFADRRSEMDVDESGTLQGYSPSSTTSIGSEVTVKRKTSNLFHSNTSFLEAASSCEELLKHSELRPVKILHNLSAQIDSVYSRRHVGDTPTNRLTRRGKRVEDQENDPTTLKQMYHVLKDVINTQQDNRRKNAYDRENGDFNQLYTTIKDLKSEQLEFRNIIRHQQDRISDYHTRCVKAHDIMKTQKHEIDKLQVNNNQLESSIFHDIDSLRSKIDIKLKSVAQLPLLMHEEHIKYEKALRENCLMAEKMHTLQKEATQLKTKIDELGKRKLITVNRLKAAERDLKIFKNYNATLKTEKRRIADELATMRAQMDSLQAASKRQLSRHREQTEKQRRELQKRIFDLELKLSRSQNSTSSLIQERDSLIAELQTQLHTLVHNFEVSQKHIRVLRRHIYTMTTGGVVSGSAAGASAGAPHSSSEPNVTRTKLN
ncbi:GH13692 [Drosophila grimshawi]|uniref:GH13692 n=2 Tax=Drosophila grimshawi TaxID=7222 RepID=B4JQG5_DROGR|nr:GH13692 [Drosophila grimshawi]